MKTWQWIVLVLVAYLFFLAANIPAAYVTDFVHKNSQNKIAFSNVSGTLFVGRADVLYIEGKSITNFTWQLSPLSLLMLNASLDVNGGSIRESEQIYINGNVSIPLFNTQKVKLTDASILVPAKDLFSQLSLPVVVTAQGRFRLDIDTLVFEQSCQSLEGTGNWLKAAVNINNNPIDLQSFSAVLSCNSPAFVVQIDPDNGISLDGKISITPSGKYSAAGEFTIPQNFPNEIKQGAAFFGENLGGGRYRLDL